MSRMSSRRELFLDIVQQSNAACSSGDYPSALKLYTEALKIDPNNHVLYSNRSAAFIKMGQFSRALKDALRCRELNPKWSKAYYRQGVALQCLGKHGEALVAFSSGLAQEPKSSQLLSGLFEAAMKSPLKGSLEPLFDQLRRMKLDESPFVVISVIGQELLSSGFWSSAVTLLENALKIGTPNLKLKGSVFSALSSACWALNAVEKAISYMEQDLSVAKTLGDTGGECRVHGNIGSAYFSKRNYKAALTSHRYQLVLAMKSKDTLAAGAALTSLGHVYSGIGDTSNALASHQQCVQLMKQVGEKLLEAREIGNVGSVYLGMGDLDSAADCHAEHLRLAKELENKTEEAKALANLGSVAHYRRNYDQSAQFYTQTLSIATELNDKSLEARGYAGLGHAARSSGDYQLAKSWHEKQLQVALSTRDRLGEGRALSNLGIVYQLLGEHESALKLYQAHLQLSLSIGDRGGAGRAYGNIGNAFNALGYHEEAINHLTMELGISTEVNDRNSEAATHGNLAVAYQALGQFQTALSHYHSHLNISRDLKDTQGEACALLNLGNCHSSAGEFEEAISYYENYLMLSQELGDVEGEGKACHFLGYAHYSLSNFKEAVRYYDQDLALAKDTGNSLNIGRAYCNLGLTHFALTNYDLALECQTNFLALAHATQNLESKFRALGNIGHVLLKMKREEEAVKIYRKQLLLGKANGDKRLEANACASLGIAHRCMKQHEESLTYHEEELKLRREIGDAEGECRALGSLGGAQMSLGAYGTAIEYYEEMLRSAKALQDCIATAQAYGNLGIGRINLGDYAEGLLLFELQLQSFETLGTPISSPILAEKAHALSNLGYCLTAVGRHKQGLSFYERALPIFQKLENVGEVERTERSIGLVLRTLGNHSEALDHFERRLTTLSPDAQLEAFNDIGNTYLEMKDFEEALRSFERQLKLSRESGMKREECKALGNIGKCYGEMNDWSESLRHHQLELDIGRELGSASEQCLAFSRIGFVHESSGNYEEALGSYQEYLAFGTAARDIFAQATALSNIGRIEHLLGNTIQSVAYLKEGLHLVQKFSAPEEEAKINHFLGLALWRQDDLESAELHLRKSIQILEKVRESAPWRTDFSLILFDREVASYQALERVLVLTEKTDEALVIAEKARCIPHSKLEKSESTPVQIIQTVEDLLSKVNQLRSALLYFSIVGTYLFSWLLIPGRGIVKFNECSLSGEVDDDDERKSMDALIEKYVQGTREALGLDLVPEYTDTGTESENWPSHLEELGDKLNQDQDKTGFLRMVSRNHRFNCSSYSLSSLFSTTGSVKSYRSDNSRSKPRERRKSGNWQGPSSLRSLYQILIAPFEEELTALDSTCFQELILVVETALLSVPFPLLRSCTSEEYLAEKFKIIITPSLFSTRTKASPSPSPPSFLIIGNPELNSALREEWGWAELPSGEAEATFIGNLLKTQALTGASATKEQVVAQLPSATLVHFATHISWRLSGLVLGSDSPSLPLSLLTAAEILKLELKAKVVVLSSFGSKIKSSDSGLSGETLIGLGKALLARGVASVLVSLWPVPDGASLTFFGCFYSALLQGAPVSHAVSEAMLYLQQSTQYNQPVNWAGYLLLGSDSRLTRKGILPGQAILELLRTSDRSKDVLRVSLHLIEKSLQRINSGQKNAMYTTQKSIENKVGSISGWEEILSSVGFRFEPPANGLPAAVFFPQIDPGERLVKCSACLQALLGLPPGPIRALTKLLETPEACEDVIGILREAISEMRIRDWVNDQIKLKINVKLWGVVGCHELLAALGFDLIEVGENEVILGIGNGVTLRMLQLALQATLSLYESLGIEEEASYNGRHSLETLEFQAEELEMKNERKYIPPKLGMGKGAFTSYVRSRGEPDGDTNVSSSEAQAQPSTAPSTLPERLGMNFSLASTINRADSTASSESSANGVATIRRAPPPPVPKTRDSDGSVKTESSHPDLKPGRRVTWKTGKGSEPSTKGNKQTLGPMSSGSREVLAENTYKDRNVGLDLAPPLSKLLFSSRLSLNQVDLPPVRRDERQSGEETDPDPGTLSMDETLSSFDQLSLAGDSGAEGSSTRLRIKPKTRKLSHAPIPSKRLSKTRVPPLPLLPTLKVFPREESSSSNSTSSKGSPSQLSKRDEGDGRSLTDSQYGSYSPSMAIAQTQGDHLQSLYFPKESKQKLYTKDSPIRTATINLSSINNQKSTEC